MDLQFLVSSLRFLLELIMHFHCGRFANFFQHSEFARNTAMLFVLQ